MLTNNDILKKLRVALNLRSEEILAILKLADFDLSESELKAFFRSEEDANYREAGDQVLRRFLDGLIIKNRGKKDDGAVHEPRGGAGKPSSAPLDRPRRPQEPPRVKKIPKGSGKDRQPKTQE